MFEREKKDQKALVSVAGKLLSSLKQGQKKFPVPKQITRNLSVELMLAETGTRTETVGGAPPAYVPDYFYKKYQSWYTETRELVSVLLPRRTEDFVRYYSGAKKNDSDATIENFILKKWVAHTRRDLELITSAFENQYRILDSATTRFESSLMDLRQLLQANLFDSEVESAKYLAKNGYLRAAGAVCGVVLEAHLKQVCAAHGISVRNNSGLRDLYEALKTNEIIDLAKWRFIQHLGDIRNKCDHKQTQEPTPVEIDDFAQGVDKILKTVA